MSQCSVPDCDNPFYARTLCKSHYGKALYRGTLPAKRTDAEQYEIDRVRFEGNRDTSGGAEACWPWRGRLNKGGYGVATFGRRERLAHRVAWMFATGPIPDDLTVDHMCYSPSCVNPAHLRLLTSRQNAAFQRRAFKTHCVNGHEFDAENTYWRPDWTETRSLGKRMCRACSRERGRQRDALRRAARRGDVA